MENALSAASTFAPLSFCTRASSCRFSSTLASSTTKHGEGTRPRSSRAKRSVHGCIQLDDLPWQAARADHLEEGVGVELLHVEDALAAPLAGQHHLGAHRGRHAGGVGDRLRLHFVVGGRGGSQLGGAAGVYWGGMLDRVSG